MREAVRTVMVASVMLLGLAAAPVCHAQEAAAPDDRVERLVENHAGNDRLQTERPEWEPEAPDFEPPERNRIIEAIADFFAWLFRSFGSFFQILLYAGIASVILYALWYMFADVIALSFQRRQKADGPDISDIREERPGRRQAAVLLEQADALAAEGRFAEAVHLLLFRSIEDLRERRSDGLPPSLTAREIQSLSDLSTRARQALAPIIRIVENSFFGGRAVDREGWQQARSSYETFAFGEVSA